MNIATLTPWLTFAGLFVTAMVTPYATEWAKARFGKTQREEQALAEARDDWRDDLKLCREMLRDERADLKAECEAHEATKAEFARYRQQKQQEIADLLLQLAQRK